MSAEHRKPLVAFIALAFVATVLVGVQRADAQAGRFLATMLGSTERVHGLLPELSASEISGERMERLAPAFGLVIASDRARERAAVDGTPARQELTRGEGRLRSSAAAGGRGPASAAERAVRRFPDERSSAWAQQRAQRRLSVRDPRGRSASAGRHSGDRAEPRRSGRSGNADRAASRGDARGGIGNVVPRQSAAD